jgi:hypothetical protein
VVTLPVALPLRLAADDPQEALFELDDAITGDGGHRQRPGSRLLNGPVEE